MSFKGIKVNGFCYAGEHLLVATDNGVMIKTGDAIKTLNVNNGLKSNKINCVSVYQQKYIFGSDAGLMVYNPENEKVINYGIEQGLIDEGILTVVNQGNQYLWIGSNSGLMRFSPKEFKYYTVGPDNNSNVIKCLLLDREDNVWMGTHSGLFKYRDDAFSSFDKVNGPGNAFIFQIFRDHTGNLWLCTDNSGIYKYSGGYFKRYGLKEGLNTNVAKAGLQHSNKKILFGTKDGIVEYKNDRFYEIPIPKEFAGLCEMLIEDKDGSVWIAGGNGVALMKWVNNTPQLTYKALPSSVSHQAYCLWKDSENTIWIGSSPAGLFKVEGDSIVSMNRRLNLKEENFYAIRDYKNYLLVATLNGLYILNTKTGEGNYINESDGLNSELVYSIELTRDRKNLWIGTNQGINKLNLEKYFTDQVIQIESYSKQDGFTGVECNSNGIWEDENGTLWFGTVSGLVKHEPSKLKPNKVKNSTLIQSIKIFSEDTLLKDGSELESKFNTIAFYYKGICFTNPENVKYRKQLVGLEKEWSEPNNENYSKYANLAPGNYTFMVKSCNNEGVWDENPTTFSFTILRPFYATWWFNALLISTILLLAYTAFTIRVKSIQRKQKQETERRVELSKIELKALRAQMNPHFIFNSLNSIQHYIFNSKSDEAIKYLSKFARLVRTILNNSNKPYVTVGEDLEALILYLELEQMRFEGKFEYEIIVDNKVDIDYDIMPPLLIQPYVENAILHGLNPKPGKGKLSISFKSADNYLICIISDDGIGREKASEIKRTMPVSKHKSLGMKITEDRLRIMNDASNSPLSVEITDLKNEAGLACGTEVKIFIPIMG
ncbi:MAG: histidine kinase [Sphingobacteriaceae bacterium]|nr:histidine kinase [Sphingobacteriaceae bacterium]